MNIKTAIARRPWILAVFVFFVVAVWMATGIGNQNITTDTSQITAPGDATGAPRVQIETMNAEPISRFISVSAAPPPPVR